MGTIPCFSFSWISSPVSSCPLRSVSPFSGGGTWSRWWTSEGGGGDDCSAAAQPCPASPAPVESGWRVGGGRGPVSVGIHKTRT